MAKQTKKTQTKSYLMEFNSNDGLHRILGMGEE